MSPQQEQQLRMQAQARGYDEAKTNAYIQFVANKTQQQLDNSQPKSYVQPATQGDGFFKSLVKDPIKTLVVKPATRIGQAIVAPVGLEMQKGNNEARKVQQDTVDMLLKAYKAEIDPVKRQKLMERIKQENQQLNALSSEAQNIQSKMDVVNNDQQLNTPFGNYNVEAQKGGTAGVKQIAGDALKTASYLYAPGAAKGVVKTAGQAFVKGALTGAKAGAIGAGTYAAGDALNQDKSFKDVAVDTLKGAGMGALTGALIGGTISAGFKGYENLKAMRNPSMDSATVQKTIKHVENKYDEIFTGTKYGKKTYERSMAQGKTPSKFLAEHGYIVDIENGKINATNTIKQIYDHSQPLDDVLDDILKAKDKASASGDLVPLDELGYKAKKAINTPENKASGYLQQQYKQIDSIIESLKSEFGDVVNLEQTNLIKRGQWNQSKVFDATRPSYVNDIHYQLGKQAKQIIEDKVSEADIKGLNSYIGDHFDAIKNLERVNGNAVKSGRLGNYFGRTTGAIIGSQGGPLGSIAGMYAGDAITNIMQNNFIGGPIKKMMLQKIMQETAVNSAQYKSAQAVLNKINNDWLSRGLPAPKAGAPNSSINIPQGTLPKNPGNNGIDMPFKGTGALTRQPSLAEEAAALGGDAAQRPTHQQVIETLINTEQYGKAKQLILNMSDQDRYKKSMINVINQYLPKSEQIKDVITRAVRTPRK